jgi:hypothetical protein
MKLELKLFLLVDIVCCLMGATVPANKRRFDFEFDDDLYREFERKIGVKLDQSYEKCTKTRLSVNEKGPNEPTRNTCFSKNPYFNEDPASTTGKLFVYNENVIGLVTNSDLSIRFFSVNNQQRQLTPMFTKYFRSLAPYAACVDFDKNIYVVYPDSQTIGKFILSKNGKQLEEVLAVKESDYSPSAISCSHNEIYVSERPTNIIRVYDTNLELLRTIDLKGVVISAHRSISVNRNANVFVDDSSAVGFFNDMTKSDQQPDGPKSSVANVCHFYLSKDCVEDVHSYSDHSKQKTFIYIVNSCTRDVLQYEYHHAHKNLTLVHTMKTEGIPISVVRNDNGFVYVLTSAPYRIDVFKPSECKLPNFSSKWRIRSN